MHKLGFSLQTSYSLPVSDVISMLKNAGFNALSPVCSEKLDLAEIAKKACENGMEIQSLHGVHKGIFRMWSRDNACRTEVLNALLGGVDDCAMYDIPILVVHPWNGFNYDFIKDNLYFDNFDVLVDRACKRSVKIAFENLEGPEFLGAVLERYKGVSEVGYCWDSGHELCYAPHTDFLALYGDRLIMTHLNDNFSITREDGKLQGEDDLHLLVGDGIADWERNVSRLKKAKKQDILNFELKIRPKGERCVNDLYSHMKLEEYFQKAYISAMSIAEEYWK